MRTSPLDNITALLFISAIKTLHDINNKRHDCYSRLYENTPWGYLPNMERVGYYKALARSRYKALATAAVGGLLMYNAYSTVSTLVSGEDPGVAHAVVNGGFALLGVRKVIGSL